MAENFVLKLDKFLGLDTSGNAIPVGASPNMLNFKINENYDLEKREGYRKLFSAEGTIRGFWTGKYGGETYYLAVVSDLLYVSKSGFDTLTALDGVVPGVEAVNFISFYDGIYLLTGQGIRRFDGERLSEIEAHIPTVMISTTPAGAGVTFEEPNLLTALCKQIFSSDGTSINYFLFTRQVSRVIRVTVDGEDWNDSQYYWDEVFCRLVFMEAPPVGVDNVEVLFELYREDASDRIFHCRYAVGFGGANDTRVFLYGNPDTPAMRYHSGVVDGKPSFAYFPELGYTLVGSGSPITAILRHYDRQLIFTEHSAYYSYLEYTTGESEKLIASFPVLPLSDDRGCVPEGQALLVENTPCTLMPTGLFQWVSTNIRDERNAQSISDSIAKALQKEDASKAILFYRKATSELYLSFFGRVYVYQKRLKLFYYYELPPLIGFSELDNQFYFATEEGIYLVEGSSDEGEEIPVRWYSGIVAMADGSRKKNLYGLTVLAEAEAPTKAVITLTEENERGTVTNATILPEGKELTSATIRLPIRRTRLVRFRLESVGEGPLCIREMQLRGRLVGSQ